MLFGKVDADSTKHFGEMPRRFAYIVGLGVPLRSGHAHKTVPLVPKGVGELIEAFPIEPPIAFETTRDVPTVAADIFDQFFGGIPTVKLHLNVPARRQEGTQHGEHLARQMILAVKRNALTGGTMPIEPAHRFLAQVEA